MSLVKKLGSTFLLLLSSSLYLLDVVSDVLLAVKYFSNGDAWWGGFTTLFLVLPWTLSVAIGVVVCFIDSKWTTRLCGAASILGCFPVAANLLYLTELWSEEDEGTKTEREARLLKNLALVFVAAEVVLEATPQFALQLYVVGRYNRFDLLQIVSIASSLASAALSIVSGALVVLQKDFQLPYSLPRELLFKLIFFLWTASHLAVFVVSLSLFSSLKGHAHAANMAAVLYLPLHLLLAGGVIVDDGVGAACRFVVGAATQTLFLVVVGAVSSQWFVSLAPFVPTSTLDVVPAPIWPNPPSPLRRWVVTVAAESNGSIPEWARCNGTSQAHATAFYLRQNCVTSVASYLYVALLSLAIFVFLYDAALAIWWRHCGVFYFSEPIRVVARMKESTRRMTKKMRRRRKRGRREIEKGGREGEKEGTELGEIAGSINASTVTLTL